jgi:hypothetical protein
MGTFLVFVTPVLSAFRSRGFRLTLAFWVTCLLVSPFSVDADTDELELPDISAFALGTDINIRSVREVKADSFNVVLRAAQDCGQEWTESFMLIALTFAGVQFTGSRQRVDVQIEPSEWESGRTLRWARVTIEDIGWLDDAQYGERYVIWLAPDKDGRLVVKRALWARLCSRAYWRFYSSELCP